jgi:hypothetical protein
MANEIVSGDLKNNGGLVAEVLGAAIRAKFDASALRNLMRFIPFNMRGSDTMQIPVLPAFGAMAAFNSELDPQIVNSAYTTAKRTLAVSGFGRALQISDLSQILAGQVNADELIAQLAASLDLTLTDRLCALFSGVSGNVGTTTVDATVDDVYDALFYLNLNNGVGQVSAVLHGQQINDVISSIRGETGPGQFNIGAQSALTNVVGFGQKAFSFAGIDFYQSDSVGLANANADRQGCVFVPDAFGYSVADPRAVDPLLSADDVVLMTDMLYIERVRNGANRQTQMQATAYIGTVELQDTSAVKFTTDA